MALHRGQGNWVRSWVLWREDWSPGMFHRIPRESGPTVGTKKSCLAVIIAGIQ